MHQGYLKFYQLILSFVHTMLSLLVESRNMTYCDQDGLALVATQHNHEVDELTTNCSKICFVGSCFTWDTALSISWPIGNDNVSFSENHAFYRLLVQKNHLL